MKKYIYIIAIAFLFIQCSSDDNDRQGVYFPKQIEIKTLKGLQVTTTYVLTYNPQNLITKIEKQTSIANENALKEIRISYTSNLDVKEIRSINNNNSETLTTFGHDDFGIINQMDIKTDESDIKIEVNYNPVQNLYTLDGMLSNFPMYFNFDHVEVLQSVSGPTINNRVITHDVDKNGLFQNLRPQPELIFWSELFIFGEFTLALNYLTPKQINSISQELDENINFENFKRDESENIISYTFKTILVERQYNITYQVRHL